MEWAGNESVRAYDRSEWLKSLFLRLFIPQKKFISLIYSLAAEILQSN